MNTKSQDLLTGLPNCLRSLEILTRADCMFLRPPHDALQIKGFGVLCAPTIQGRIFTHTIPEDSSITIPARRSAAPAAEENTATRTITTLGHAQNLVTHCVLAYRRLSFSVLSQCRASMVQPWTRASVRVPFRV